MRARLCWAVGLVLVSVASGRAAAQQRLPADSLERMRRYAEWFIGGQADSVWAHVNTTGRRAIQGVATLSERSSMFREAAGTSLELVEERFVWRGPARQYWRTMRSSVAPENVVLRLVVGNDGEIEGMGISLVSTVPPIDSGGPVIRAGRGG